MLFGTWCTGNLSRYPCTKWNSKELKNINFLCARILAPCYRWHTASMKPKWTKRDEERKESSKTSTRWQSVVKIPTFHASKFQLLRTSLCSPGRESQTAAGRCSQRSSISVFWLITTSKPWGCSWRKTCGWCCSLEANLQSSSWILKCCDFEAPPKKAKQ